MTKLPLVYHPHYSILWPKAHRFPMTKFEMFYNYLLQGGLADPDQFHEPRPASESTLGLVHSPQYLSAFQDGSWSEKVQRRIGMPWYPELVLRTHAEVGGTILTTRLALEYGLACNMAGGTHHAFPDHGSGFCILNDMAVAARLALVQGRVRQVLIIDLDVHQGDGNAFIFKDEPRVFTFSVHGARNFPARKQVSDLDIGLENETGDEAYLAVLYERLPDLLSRIRPDLVLYDAGVDVHGEDRLGKFALTDEGLAQRDRYVLGTCVKQGFPVACVVGGGYARDRNELPRLHGYLYQAAAQVYQAHRL